MGQPDAGEAEDLGPPDTGIEVERVPVWVAQGDVGRTIMSCDDGRTWINDRAFDSEGDVDMCGIVQDVRCFDSDSGCQFLRDDQCETKTSRCDCSHSPGTGRGIAYGDGWFVTTWGWGPKGGLRISRDGANWTKAVDDTVFGGVQFVEGRFVAGSRSPLVAEDPRTWTEGEPARIVDGSGTGIYTTRKLLRLDLTDGQLLILAGGSSSSHGILLSDDAGDSWWTPEVMPRGCGDSVAGAAGGDGVILMIGQDDTVCRSVDGGQSFATSNVGFDDKIESGPLWTGTEFQAWGRGAMFSSSDGLNWTRTPLDGDGGSETFAVVGRSPVTGNYVAVSGGWQQWYEEQGFFRSEDGVTWELLDPSNFVASHPIRQLTFGWIDETPDCPAP